MRNNRINPNKFSGYDNRKDNIKITCTCLLEEKPTTQEHFLK